MADEADIANEYMMAAVARALHNKQPPAAVKMGPQSCTECDETIPHARRLLGFQLCIVCARENERQRALFADY